jgi:tight adherence protein B
MHRREEVGARVVGGFVSPPPQTESQRQQTLVQRALGDRTKQRAEGEMMQAILEELEIGKVTLPLPQLVMFTVIGAVLVGWIVILSTKSDLAGLLGLMVPLAAVVAVRTMAGRQRRAFEEQLPDNLQIVASAMRAGQTFVGALGVVVSDAPEPSRTELRRALTDEQLGFPLGDALGNVARRMKSLDFEHVAFVATLQRETGGNTAEVVDLVTETIRDRIELKRMVRALTAQGRLAGGILSALPAALLLFLSVIASNYVHPLFHSKVGAIVLGAGVVLTVSGGLIIRKIVDVEV